MLSAAEVRLRRVGEELRNGAAGAAQGGAHLALVEAQVLFPTGMYVVVAPFLAGELADPVDGVVVVVAEQETPPGANG